MVYLWSRTVSLLLLTIALIGGYFAWQSGQERAALLSQIARIEKRIGSFPIVDPALVHVLAIDLRISLPSELFESLKLKLKNSNGQSMTEDLLQIRFVKRTP